MCICAMDKGPHVNFTSNDKAEGILGINDEYNYERSRGLELGLLPPREIFPYIQNSFSQ